MHGYYPDCAAHTSTTESDIVVSMDVILNFKKLSVPNEEVNMRDATSNHSSDGFSTDADDHFKPYTGENCKRRRLDQDGIKQKAKARWRRVFAVEAHCFGFT